MGWIWRGVFLLSALISMFFTYKALSYLRDYFSLNEKSIAQQMEWSVVEKGPASFALLVSYQFEGSSDAPCTPPSLYQGRTEFAKPYFLNAPSAMRALKELSGQAGSGESWKVFYRKKDPAINSLQRLFPFKECIHAFLTAGVSVYFFFLKRVLHRSLAVHESF